MTLKIKYHNPRIDKVRKTEKGDWIDLRAAETVALKKGEYATVSLGISVQLPEGYEAHVAPRSSTFRTWGVVMTNSVGVVDESYCGENDIWRIPVLATRDTVIRENDRICQFRIMKKMPELVIEEVENLAAPDWGGFGSTGTN